MMLRKVKLEIPGNKMNNSHLFSKTSNTPSTRALTRLLSEQLGRQFCLFGLFWLCGFVLSLERRTQNG